MKGRPRRRPRHSPFPARNEPRRSSQIELPHDETRPPRARSSDFLAASSPLCFDGPRALDEMAQDTRREIREM